MGCGSSKETIDSGRAFSSLQSQPNRPSDHDWRFDVQPYHEQLNRGVSVANAEPQQRQGSRSDGPRGPNAGGSDTSIVEQVLLIDEAAKVFHMLSEHQRVMMLELATHQDDESISQKLDQTTTSAFNTVLQFCEALTAIIGREENINEPNKVIAMFANTTISFMTVKTIINMYDLVLLRSEESLWPSSKTDQEPMNLIQDKQADEGPMNGSAIRDTRHALKIQERIETMDFHISHIEAVCRKLRDVSWSIIQGMSQSKMLDGTNHSQMSQNEAIEEILKAALSTRQQITKLKTKIHSPPSP